MAGKVFFSVSMSLDGFIAPGSLGELMGQQWMELQQWIFPQRFFRENLKLGEGGEEGRENDIVRETFERTGASVIGKRMYLVALSARRGWRACRWSQVPGLFSRGQRGGSAGHFYRAPGSERAGAQDGPAGCRCPGAGRRRL